jgi:hypothetical protein
MLKGKWTYRSFENNPALVDGDAKAALALIFGEGVFDFEAVSPTRFTGGLGMGSGYALTLTGSVSLGCDPIPTQFSMIGEGLAGTPTEGWRYDYRGIVGYSWPTAVDQTTSLLGTVVRVNAHGAGAPAGYTASFIAVEQPAPPPRTQRRFALLAG